MRKSTLLFAMIFVFTNIFAQNTVAKNTSHSIEIDPIVPLVLHGYGAHYMFAPDESKHFVFGATIIAAATMPSFVINTDPVNKNEGWHVRINQGFGLEGEYHFVNTTKGPFVGIQLFTQEINITNDNEPSVEKHRTNTGMSGLLAGYKVYVFGNHFDL